MSEPVRISEHEISERPVKLDRKQLMTLSSLKNQIEVLPSTEPNLYYLKGTSWVGSLAIPGLVISIGAKIGAVDVLRMQLLSDEPHNPIEVPSLSRTGDTIWDLIAICLIREVDILSIIGFEKQYIEVEENSWIARGQIPIYQDLLANSPLRFGVLSRYSVLHPDLDRNKALLWALGLLQMVTKEPIRKRLQSISYRLEGVTAPVSCPEIQLPEPGHPYRRPLYLVDLLRRSLATGMNSFGLNASGLILDMNKVFEGYVRVKLREAIEPSGYVIDSKKDGAEYLCQGVRLEPDLIVRGRQGEVVMLGDCKYKVNWNYENSDVFQMLAYLEGYKGTKISFIIYPCESQSIQAKSVVLPGKRPLISIGLPIASVKENTIFTEVASILSKAVESYQQGLVG